MVSDSQLIERLREFLRTADLSTTTTAIVRKRLEEDFQVDLTGKKVFIREQVDLYLQSQQENDKDDAEEDGDGEGQGDGGPEDGASGSGEGEDDGEDEEEEEEEEGDERAGGSRKRPDKKRGGGGFTKLCGLSPELQKIVGVSKLPRTKVVQQLWVYIRAHDLQDPENRQNIRCDKLLHSVFNADSINMFQMNKVLSNHIYPLPPGDNGEVESNEKPLKMEKCKEKGKDEFKPKAKRPKKEKGEVGKGSTHLSAPLPLSDALVKFIGTGEDALSRGEVIKRIWAYIKEKELQDPADKRRIICDEKLKKLFEVDSFTGFTVTKLLSAHFVKAEQ